MAINKVQFGNQTLIDLTGTTATADTILQGYGAYGKDGVWIDGTATQGEAPEAVRKDVNFYDYEGTVLYSYTAQEFLELDNMPANPSHTGLTAQGWNWTLADAKTIVTSMGGIDIGQNYITDDGNTRLYLDVYNPETPVEIRIKAVSGNTAIINWGDGNTTTVTSTTINTYTHTYSTQNIYKVVISGLFSTDSGGGYYNILGRNNRYPYTSRLVAAELGSAFNSIIIRGTFQACMCLKTVTIPSTITKIEQDVFASCKSLRAVIYPIELTTMGNNVQNQCSSAVAVTLPKKLTSLGTGIFNYRENVSGRYIIPPNITALPNNFCGYNYNMQEVKLPNTVTSIGFYSFGMCYALTKLVIPATVTSIASQAFYNCTGMLEYHFQPTTPPTLANTNAFNSIPNNCVFYVPYSADHSILNAYKTAQNWSTYSSRMVDE